MEVLTCNNPFTGSKPNVDCSLYDGDLCAAEDRSSDLSNGVCYWRLCGGLSSAQASDAYRVSASLTSFNDLLH